MGIIMPRKKKDGAKSLTADVGWTRDGKVARTLGDTFGGRQGAKR